LTYRSVLNLTFSRSSEQLKAAISRKVGNSAKALERELKASIAT
jgi:hypothetical protein